MYIESTEGDCKKGSKVGNLETLFRGYSINVGRRLVLKTVSEDSFRLSAASEQLSETARGTSLCTSAISRMAVNEELKLQTETEMVIRILLSAFGYQQPAIRDRSLSQPPNLPSAARNSFMPTLNEQLPFCDHYYLKACRLLYRNTFDIRVMYPPNSL